MVGHEECSTCCRHVLDASGLDPPVVAVQDLEDGEERFCPLRVKPKVVHRVRGATLSKLALLIGKLNKTHYAVEVDDFVAGRFA